MYRPFSTFFYPNLLKTNLLFFACALFLLYSCGTTKPTVGSKEITGKPKPKNITATYAAMLGVDKNKIDNVALYSFIDEWYSTPYQYGGKSKKGIDCSGFIILLYQQVYKKNLSGTSESIYQQCNTVSKSKLKEGDLVFFKIDSKKVTHIGIYLQNNKFVHASTKKGVMISDLKEAYFKKYYYRSGRL